MNDLAFHPTRPIFFSGSEDRSIKIFDYSRENAKRAIRQINESGDVRSISLHPSGDFLAVATDSPVVTFKLRYNSSNQCLDFFLY